MSRFCDIAFGERSQELIDDEVCCAAADGVDATWVRLVQQRSAVDLQILRAGVGRAAFRHGPRGSACVADMPLAGLWIGQDHLLCNAAIIGDSLRIADTPMPYRVASFAVRDAAGDTVGLLEIGRAGDAYREQDLTFLRTLAQCFGAASQLCLSAYRPVFDPAALIALAP